MCVSLTGFYALSLMFLPGCRVSLSSPALQPVYKGRCAARPMRISVPGGCQGGPGGGETWLLSGGPGGGETWLLSGGAGGGETWLLSGGARGRRDLGAVRGARGRRDLADRKSTRLNSSHL